MEKNKKDYTNDLFSWSTKQERGKVKWFNEEKGYGFIEPENGGTDVFFHFSSIKVKGFKTLANGQLVEFDTEKTDKGIKAKTVKIILV